MRAPIVGARALVRNPPGASMSPAGGRVSRLPAQGAFLPLIRRSSREPRQKRFDDTALLLQGSALVIGCASIHRLTAV